MMQDFEEKTMIMTTSADEDEAAASTVACHFGDASHSFAVSNLCRSSSDGNFAEKAQAEVGTDPDPSILTLCRSPSCSTNASPTVSSTQSRRTGTVN